MIGPYIGLAMAAFFIFSIIVLTIACIIIDIIIWISNLTHEIIVSGFGKRKIITNKPKTLNY